MDELTWKGQVLKSRMATPDFFLLVVAEYIVGYKACAKLNDPVKLKWVS